MGDYLFWDVGGVNISVLNEVCPRPISSMMLLIPLPNCSWETGKTSESQHVIFFNVTSIAQHLANWRSLKGAPVWEMALMPTVGLENVTPQVADQIAARMKWLNDQGIVIWLRFAHEVSAVAFLLMSVVHMWFKLVDVATSDEWWVVHMGAETKM